MRQQRATYDYFRPLREVRVLFLLAMLVMGVGQVWGGQETRNGKQYNVVYLNNGASGTGDSKDSPVGTWADAYAKLINTGDRDYDWEHNIIVIVPGGNMTPNFTEGDTKDQNKKQGTPATITGVWPWDANDCATVADIKSKGQLRINSTNHTIGADIRFRNLLIYGGNNSQNRMSLRMHSALFDMGLIMQNFSDMEENYGATKGRKAPNLHIQLTRDQTKTAGSGNEYRMPNGKPIEVTFKSGKYGRIAISRTAGSDPTNYYVQGTPENPIMAHITVDIQSGNDNTNGYADDIAILMGGSSQGFVCADLQFDIKHGTIATLVAGTQGNNISSARNATIPDASFAGRTKVNVGNEGGVDNDVTIQTYYGGTQGRAQTSQVNTAPSFFYGESEFNMYSGTVESGVYGSATAFSGVGDATNHTPDYAIPYVNGSNVLTFGSYNGSGTMATVKSTFHKGEDGYIAGKDYINLSTTKITFNIYGGHIYEGLYGGSKGYEPQIDASKAVEGAGTHFGDTYVNVYGGTIEGGVYGGGLGTKEYFDEIYKTDSKTTKFLTVAQVLGNTHVNIYGGDIYGNIYGGGYGIATDKNEYIPIAKVIGTTNVTINPTDPSWTFTGNIYGGGALSAVEGSTNVQVLGGNIIGNVFAGGLGEDGHANKAKVTGNTEANIKGGTQGNEYAVYGGAQMAQVDGNTTVNLLGGSIGSAYGGGLGTGVMAANVSGNTLVNLGAMEDDGEGNLIATGNAMVNNIFGCNNLNGAPSGTVTVNVISGTVNNVYGGGNQANASVSPVVNINGGTVTNEVYGGGALANVTGNTTVNLTGGTIGNSYGGGLGSNEVAALVGGNATTTLNGSKVNGNIFGANNINGTPQGHVKVHVLATAKRDEQDPEDENQYDVAAVYGGGNQAAYEPTDDNDFAEVIIENCENSIDYVYGGGNAAPVPATDVKIYGANAINNAFAGGNGAGQSSNPAAANYNPGADIGYLEYTRDNEHEYGSGESHIAVYGGTVNNVFGGSNTLGYIRTHAHVSLPDPNGTTTCELQVGEIYVGGNRAEMLCDGTISCECTGGVKEIYGGSKRANFYQDVHMIISSGTFGKVFGGNNISGNLKGNITIDIDETGCYPVMIGELYGGGNQAAYSVYGYNDDGTVKTSGTKEYTDPTINLISFTQIGKVFGGGLGETAVMYGDPTVNINPIKGKFAGTNATPNYVLNSENERVSNTEEIAIPDAVGTIGTVYGGGNEAAVYGNTNVKIATEAKNHHLTPDAEDEDVDAIVTGNVYGGGSQADVHGNTNVTIGE